MDNEREDNGPALTAVGYSFINGNDPQIRTFVASLSAGFTLAIFESLQALTPATIGDVGRFLLSFVVTVGLFNFLYYLLGRTVTAVLAVITRQTRIRGRWLHVLYFDDGAVRKVRHGPVHIRTTVAGDLRLNGINLAPDNAYNSNWHSLLVGLNDTRLTLIFESLTPYRGGIMGLMVMDVFKSTTGHDVLVGYFSDAAADGKRGHITLFRNQEDYQAELDRVGKMSAYDPLAKNA